MAEPINAFESEMRMWPSGSPPEKYLEPGRSLPLQTAADRRGQNRMGNYRRTQAANLIRTSGKVEIIGKVDASRAEKQ
jgi:hypothetical protein